jgi:Ca2+/Na+ antiporter
MAILYKLALLSLLTSLIVLAVRFLIVPGIDKTSLALNFGSKARGQLLGYVTSIPEFVIVISSAAAGVFDAGFWNIASSNVINWVLFLSAVFTFRQCRDLKRSTFVDEISFGIFSVVLPLVLYKFEVQGSAILATCLLFVFIAYKVVDRRLNRRVNAAEKRDEDVSNLFFALSSIVTGVILIAVSGWYLGGVAESLVVELGVSAWMIGWILGFISSIPEMSGFFEIYRKHKKAGTLKGIDDTQEALDTLVASNMSNLGIILPVGVFIAAAL